MTVRFVHRKGGGASVPLLGPSDFTYIGAFKLPGGTLGDDFFDTAKGQLAGNVYYDPGHSGLPSLFIAGFRSGGLVSATPSLAQISIPTPLDPGVVGVAGLNTATMYQNFTDPSNGHTPMESAGVCGYVVYGGHVVGVGAASYDGSGSQPAAAFVTNSMTLTGGATGPYTLAATDPHWGAIKQTIFGGYAGMVPPEWQAALGAKAVCGNSQRSIINYNSAGPSLMTLDVDTLITQPSTASPIASTPLGYYWPVVVDIDGDPFARQGLGRYNYNSPGGTFQGQPVPNITVTDPLGRVMPSPVVGGPTWTIPYTDEGAEVMGVAFIDGTSTVLFIGRKGLGEDLYGTGTADPALHGTPHPVAELWTYDPDYVDNKGGHSYPYSYFIVAFDANDYVLAKQGTLSPWLVRPYTAWIPDIFCAGTLGGTAADMHAGLGGASWDATARRLYISAPYIDGPQPIIHVFGIA